MSIKLSIDDAIERSASEMPDGFEIRVCVERGSGWVQLHTKEDELIHVMSPHEGYSISDCILDCIEVACGRETPNLVDD